MAKKKDYLGEFEELVLLAILRLGSNAYGMQIRKALEEVGRYTSIGALYATLERLEQKGFVKSWQGKATPERGGRAKRYFAIDALGLRVLNETQRCREAMIRGIRPGIVPVEV